MSKFVQLLDSEVVQWWAIAGGAAAAVWRSIGSGVVDGTGVTGKSFFPHDGGNSDT
ncbi:hypothetical protein ACIBM3_07050 [Rhodococcus erythropolis]|uniref:hypothetical protein n=1 Tax=Rhodococcus erythropolis TaxID=1833 RepID=UPI0037B60F3D